MQPIESQYRALLNRPCTTWTIYELDWMHRHAVTTSKDLTRSTRARVDAAICKRIVADEMDRRANLIDRDWLANELGLDKLEICLEQ